MAVAGTVPEDYQELAETYGEYIRKLVRGKNRGKVPDQQVDEVSADIMAALIAADIITQYDPDHPSRASFSTFLTRHVLLRLRGQGDKLERLSRREVLVCDKTDAETGTPWLELHGGSAEDDHSWLDAADTCRHARAYVASLPVSGSCDLVQVFDAVAEAGLAGEKHLVKALSERFSVSTATAGQWLRRLREEVAESADRVPVTYEIAHAGLSLTARQVQEAISILAADRSTNVIHPLRRAGHPLAGASKGWYLPFAKEERAAYPECRAARGTRSQHSGHVKQAVLHRLRRLVGDIPAAEQLPVQPEPQSQPTLADALEAEFWKLGADAATVDRLMDMARKMAKA